MIKYLFFDFRILYIEKNYALTTNKKFVSEKNIQSAAELLCCQKVFIVGVQWDTNLPSGSKCSLFNIVITLTQFVFIKAKSEYFKVNHYPPDIECYNECVQNFMFIACLKVEAETALTLRQTRSSMHMTYFCIFKTFLSSDNEKP